MKRFRFTLLAVCTILLLLGGHDLWLWLRNPHPQPVTMQQLQMESPRGEWLQIDRVRLDLQQAISTSGSIELDAFLIPLPTSENGHIKVMIETRDPAILELLKTYYFKLDSEEGQRKFLKENRSRFVIERPLTGMLVGGLIASANREKLLRLAQELNLPITEDVIFVSEGKTPPRWRGLFFAVVGLFGIVRVLRAGKKNRSPQA